jgi:hypothetical protein
VLRGNDKMAYGQDGSFTLYIQNHTPGAGKEANWLTGPKGPMLLALRLYNCRKAVADGSWNPPGIEKIE